VLEEFVRTNPDGIAVDDLETTRTWVELVDRATRTGHLLRDGLGLLPGDHVAMLVPNRVEFVELVLGAFLSGVWLTPISAHLTPVEIGHILDDSGARVVFTEPERVAALTASLATPDVVLVGDELDRALASVSDEPFSPDAVPGGTMFYTSGTTGRPKGVQRARQPTVARQFGALAAAGRALGLGGTGPHLVTGPMYHAAPLGFALMDLVQGAPLVVMPKWDPGRTLSLITERGVHDTHLVPTMCVRLLRLPEPVKETFDPSSLRTVLHGAAPIAPAVKEDMLRWWGPVLTEYWGASEGGVVTLASSQEWLERPGTVGRPLPSYEVLVTDEEARPQPAGTIGTLWCRHTGDGRVFEYFGDADKTRAAHLDESTYSIGDLGWVDDAGYVFLADRVANTIISGGVNIYPAEVEAVLIRHDAVADVAVLGVADDVWGETVVAVVELVAGRNPSEGVREETMALARTELAAYKVPRSVFFVDSLPRHDNGKLAIRDVRSLLEANGPAEA
jgi:long-chain acyl-CoA synthetase